MTKEEVKLKLVNKLAKAATYDKELKEWSVNFDRAIDIIENVFNACGEIEERRTYGEEKERTDKC